MRSNGGVSAARYHHEDSMGERAEVSRWHSVTGCIGDDGGVAEQAGNVRLTAWVHGWVQGVGFRWWTRSRALELGLAGSATNLADGRVEVVAEGPEDNCARLLEALRSSTSPGRVDQVIEQWSPAHGVGDGFVER